MTLTLLVYKSRSLFQFSSIFSGMESNWCLVANGSTCLKPILSQSLSFKNTATIELCRYAAYSSPLFGKIKLDNGVTFGFGKQHLLTFCDVKENLCFEQLLREYLTCLLILTHDIKYFTSFCVMCSYAFVHTSVVEASLVRNNYLKGPCGYKQGIFLWLPHGIVSSSRHPKTLLTDDWFARENKPVWFS